MADDLESRGPADRTRVNVNEPWEVRWWCKKWGCPEQRLRDCVQRVGVMVTDIEKCLGK
jgi:hypothetical protein